MASARRSARCSLSGPRSSGAGGSAPWLSGHSQDGRPRPDGPRLAGPEVPRGRTPTGRSRSGSRVAGPGGRRRRSRATPAYDIDRRRTDPVAILRAQDDARVQDLVPIRYGRMSASAFAFYRGSAAIMAYDLSSQNRTPGHTQFCGDAHLSNFGVFGAPERDLVFDVNDFDETLPGPFEWDVKRLAASFILASRDRGFKRKEARIAVRSALQGYRDTIARLAQMGTLDVWYLRVDAQMVLDAVNQMSTSKKQAKLKTAKSARPVRCGAAQDLDEGRAEADRGRRRPSPLPRRPALVVPVGRHRRRPPPDPGGAGGLPGDAVARSPAADRALPAGRRGDEGGRRGQRGTRAGILLLDGPRRLRSAGHAVQGGHLVGARALPRSQ